MDVRLKGSEHQTLNESILDEVAEEIARCFAETFDLEQVGPDQDFFELGGDSLLGESLAIRISEYAGRQFQISSIARLSTPKKIAAFLLKGEARAEAEFVRPPIFMVHGRNGIMLPRTEFLEGLAPGQKLHIFELPGIRGAKTPHTSIEAIAADYISQLQTEYPSGPVLLGGYCRGCFITLEMAVQLANMGRPVLHMVLFDPDNAPYNVMKNFRRVRGKKDSAFKNWRNRRWLWRQLTHLRNERLRRFHERDYRRHLSRLQYDAYSSMEERFNLSLDAQAKLLAAYHQYQPKPFPGSVTVFASTARKRRFENKTSLWFQLLPNLTLQVLGETHEEVIRAQAATGAKLMQDVFDTALSRHVQQADSGNLRS